MARTSRWGPADGNEGGSGIAEEQKDRGRTDSRSRHKKSSSKHRSQEGERSAAPEPAKTETARPLSCSRSPSPVPEKAVAPRRTPLQYQHRRTAQEVFRCKKGKRTDIKPSEWDKFNYANNTEVMTREIEYGGNVVPIPRVKRKDITPEFFIEQFAKKATPVIVEGACSHWPAMHRWSIDALEERFRHVAFKVAKNDNGKKLRMKFKYYADYIRRQQDDAPLYLFETNVDDNAYIRDLTKDYEMPDIFPHDWMMLVNNESRPPFRWFCIGPKRSGTTVHIDPLGTSAWNAVTHGVKRWVLMEPGETKRRVKGKDLVKEGEDDEAVMYFDFILPRIKKAYPEMKIYEGLQNPGDIIFVPGDWWHGVLNLEDCVAVTQNYCGPDNFDLVWSKTRREREKVAYLWLRNMKKHAPELYQRAMEMNRRDNFRMRHERPKGEKLPDLSSSSSASSSDSSTDEAEDLDPAGLKAAAPAGSKLGADAFGRQGPGPQPSLVTAAVPGFERPSKRQRQNGTEDM